MAQRKTAEEKYDAFEKGMHEKLRSIARRQKTDSKFGYGKVIKVKDDQQFNIENGRYIVEISEQYLIDNHGYNYNYYCLDLDKTCKIIDTHK